MTLARKRNEGQSNEARRLPEYMGPARDAFVTSLNRCIRYINHEQMHSAKGVVIEGEEQRFMHFESALGHLEEMKSEVLGHTVVIKDNKTLEVTKTFLNLTDVELRDDEMVAIFQPNGEQEEFSLKGLGTEFKIDII